MPNISFQGKTYSFPKGTSQSEINSFLVSEHGNSGLPAPMENGMAQQGQQDVAQNQNATLAEKIAGSAPVQGVLGAGDALRKIFSLGYQDPHSGSGTAYDVGRVGGNIAGYLGGGEVLGAARAAGEGLPLIGRGLSYLGREGALPGALRRMAGGAVGGAAENPGDRLGGAEKGAALSGAFEGLPIAGKGLSGISEYIVPKKFASRLVGSMKETYDDLMKEANQWYGPVKKRFGNYHIIRGNPSQTFPALVPNVKPYLGYDVKQMIDKYLARPTFSNAHELQSQLGTELRETTGTDAASRSAMQAVRAARNALKKDMDSFLSQRSQHMADRYKAASEIFQEDVAPFRVKPIMKLIKSGDTGISPKKLEDTLRNQVAGQNLSPNHFLSQALEKISHKNESGKFAGSSFGIGAGLLGGLAGGGAPGGALGAMAGKMLSPYISQMAASPVAGNIAMEASPAYRALARALVGANLEGS